jgi:flavodoxin
MKALVVYDSVYGNTEKVAKAIGRALPCETKVLRAGDAEFSALGKFDVLVVGSPTHGGRPTAAAKSFLAKIPANALKNVGAAAFDTRTSKGGQGAFVRAVINFFGYAAPRIAKALQKKGANVIVEPEGFAVKGSEGPLQDSELERAAEWAGRLCKSGKQ